MKFFTLIVCLCLPLQFAVRAAAQQPPVQQFDTVSIRPSNPDDRSFGYNPNPNNFQAKGVDLRFLIQLAYGANANDITELPPVLRNLKFDIHAKTDVDPASPAAKLRYSSDGGRTLFEARLQSLLAERFQLKLHHATAERHVLNLAASAHPHLRPAVDQDPMQSNGPGHLKLDATDMNGLATMLSGQLATNVLDHTGILGIYAVEIKWDVSDAAGPLAYPFSVVSDALADQLGLKLVPAKASVPILSIDHATPPSPN
jgi:uncharacterized protein (TIGR03435 family)